MAKHSGDPAKHDGDMEIDVNGEGQDPVVAPGQVNVIWHWWGREWCAKGTCARVTFVIGIEDTPLYTDWPYASCEEYPGWPFDYTKYFTAPIEGVYRILGVFCAVDTKDQAIQHYLDHPELRFQVGTLTVTTEPPPPTCEEYLTQTECELADCYWYDGACHSTPAPPPELDLSVMAGGIALAVLDMALIGYYIATHIGG